MIVALSRHIFCLCICAFSLVSLVKDSQADSNTQGIIREEDRLGARSDEYSRAFERAISALVRGDVETFRALLSSTTVLNETRGPGAIDAVIKTRFIPFFADFSELTDAIVTVPSYDAAGNSGVAMARSFTTSDGEKKSFVIYLVTERQPAPGSAKAAQKNQVMVGNLLLNASAEELLKSKKNQSPGAETK